MTVRNIFLSFTIVLRESFFFLILYNPPRLKMGAAAVKGAGIKWKRGRCYSTVGFFDVNTVLVLFFFFFCPSLKAVQRRSYFFWQGIVVVLLLLQAVQNISLHSGFWAFMFVFMIPIFLYGTFEHFTNLGLKLLFLFVQVGF